MNSFRLYAALHLAVLAAGVALAFGATSPGSIRLGAECGAGVAVVTGVPVILFGARALTGSIRSALAAVVGSFLFRIVAVALGLFEAKRLGGDLLAAAGAFFALYFAGQILELTFVTGKIKAARVEENRA